MNRDRKELAFLGAVLLGWGLVVAPIAHVLFTHGADHGHGHRHGPADSEKAPHGAGALEHGAALAHTSPAVPALVLVLVPLAQLTVAAPHAPFLAAWPKVEKSQGP